MQYAASRRSCLVKYQTASFAHFWQPTFIFCQSSSTSLFLPLDHQFFQELNCPFWRALHFSTWRTTRISRWLTCRSATAARKGVWKTASLNPKRIRLLRRVFSTYAASIRAIDYFRIALMDRIEIHQPGCDCELRVHSAGGLGSCRHIFSIQSAERRARVFGLWQYCFWAWLNSHRDFPRRNGLYVSPSYGIAVCKKCTSSYDTGIL
jgi:hypothetical protein